MANQPGFHEVPAECYKRLRQICCHPGLIDADSVDKPSAKLEALLELLEPLVQEGRKVLVFSQFVGVIEILQRAPKRRCSTMSCTTSSLAAREWPHFVLTGQTEDRGQLVQEFQQCAGPAVFLLSLKASGFGLNLTAASYVVLYDPGGIPPSKTRPSTAPTASARRAPSSPTASSSKRASKKKSALCKKQKRALADDILGEGAFARALTLEDLKALLSE